VQKRRLTWVEWTAIALGLLALGTYFAWRTTNVLHEWLPNFGTELASIGITIAIVDRIVRHVRAKETAAERERATTRARALIGSAFGRLLFYIKNDELTHGSPPKPPIDTAVEMIDLWLSDAGEVAPQRPRHGDGQSVLATLTLDGARRIKELMESERSNFDQDVRQAVDDLADRAEAAAGYGALTSNSDMPPAAMDLELANVIDALKPLAEALEDQIEPVWLRRGPGSPF
jgi:hypothetical protein